MEIDLKQRPLEVAASSGFEAKDLPAELRADAQPTRDFAKMLLASEPKFRTVSNPMIEEQPSPGDVYEVTDEALKPGYIQDVTKRVAEYVNALSPRIDLIRVLVWDEKDKEKNGQPPVAQVQFAIQGYAEMVPVQVPLTLDWKDTIRKEVQAWFNHEKEYGGGVNWVGPR